MLKKLSLSLKKTRENFTVKLANLFLGKNDIGNDLLTNLETQLILADIGVPLTKEIIAHLKKLALQRKISSGEQALPIVKEKLLNLLKPLSQPLLANDTKTPAVILVVGINGSGKTTTIGKLAKKLQKDGKSVMLAAADTFRAAAIEQLKIWGERNNIPVIAQHQGSDSASVAFDALSSAQARKIDVLIIDTAGRLHTQENLMNELKKIKRVLAKKDSQVPQETLLVLDAGIGQNAMNQAREFNSAIGITGLVITKLDGTAKGGIIFAIAKELQMPIKFIGTGESIDDLGPFSAEDFIEALFA